MLNGAVIIPSLPPLFEQINNWDDRLCPYGCTMYMYNVYEKHGSLGIHVYHGICIYSDIVCNVYNSDVLQYCLTILF